MFLLPREVVRRDSKIKLMGGGWQQAAQRAKMHDTEQPECILFPSRDILEMH